MQRHYETLPYQDTKPQGAADFYFAVNATFRFILNRLGEAGWIRYLQDLGREYYKPVNDLWRQGGTSAVARYWREFFTAEPGGDVEVVESPGLVEVNVRVCPAIKQLRLGGRTPVSQFCQHCWHLGEARAREAGMTMRLSGGNGSCVHRYYCSSATPPPPPQDPNAIKETTL